MKVFLGADAEASTEEAGGEAGEAGETGEAGEAGAARKEGEGGEGGEVLLEQSHEASLMLFAITALTAQTQGRRSPAEYPVAGTMALGQGTSSAALRAMNTDEAASIEGRKLEKVETRRTA